MFAGPQRQSRDGAGDAERVRVVAGESGGQVDAQVLTLLGQCTNFAVQWGANSKCVDYLR